ncbi:hypothetical protein [Melissospora conviva]|uniref:hypothetical protein n=1 Tax=Melissospora conviva TaxID=3388432 RepID=UPI003C1AF7C0
MSTPPPIEPPPHPSHENPPPALTAVRVPEGQPFEVRPSTARRGLAYAGVVLAVMAPLTYYFFLLLGDPNRELDFDARLDLFGLVAYPLIVVGTPLGCRLWLFRASGPVLAMDPAGLWIRIPAGGRLLVAGPNGMWMRTRPAQGPVLWLPWESVARLHPQRRGLKRMLVVQPRDPRTLRRGDASTVIDDDLVRVFHGTGPAAYLNFTDRSEAEIMAAAAHHSAGRCSLA